MNLDKLKNRKQKLLERLSELSEVIEGSFFKREINGYERYYLSRMIGKKQQQKYIKKKNVDTVRKGINQHQELLEIVKELTEINLKLLKEETD